MRIILADTPSIGQYSPNLGLLYLASYVRKVLPKTEVLYLPAVRRFKDHVKAIAQFRPNLYGISFTSFDALSAYITVRRLKRIYPWLKIICGGPHTTAATDKVLMETKADVCVIGEGEETFSDITLDQNDLDGCLQTIKGIAFLKEDQIVKTEVRPFISELDDIPFPAWDLVASKDFVGEPLHRGTPTTEMAVSRGCPYDCVFCSNPVFRVTKPRLRLRSPENIAEEADLLYKMGYREIYLDSDEFNFSHNWALMVSETLARLDHKDLFFQCNMRSDIMSAELAKSLSRMNCWLVRLGIESANQRVLDGIKKRVSVGQIENACSLLSQHGIKVFGFFMMFQIWESNGQLEYETPDEVMNSLNFAKNLWKTNRLHYISWSVTTPMPGSKMYEIVTRHGLCDFNYYPCKLWDVSCHLSDISAREFSNLRRKGALLQAMMALKSGSIGWNNWRRLLLKGINMILRGRRMM